MNISSKDQARILVAFFILVGVLTFFVAVKSINEIRASKYVGREDAGAYSITVEGVGEAFAIPDTAMFTYGITEESPTVEAAQEVVSRTQNGILEYLKSEGVEEKNIRTIGYNIYPRYEFNTRGTSVCTPEFCPPSSGERELVGYEVNHTVEVKLKDVDTAGQFVQAVGQRGADNVSGVNFVIEDEDAVEALARGNAVEDAEDKAEVLAKQLGVRLGKVISFSENSGGYPKAYLAPDGRGSMEVDTQESFVPQIPVGENKVISQVYVTYEIR